MASQPESSDSSVGKSKNQMTDNLSVEIRNAVEVGDFQTAERLLEKLIEIDPMAIGEAVKTAELIENKMSDAIDKDHLASWPQLYDQLTIEERNCLFYSMKKYVLSEKTVLLKHGSLNNRLFFLEKGEIIVGLPQEANKFKILTQLGPGDILGEYTFATIAACSATAITKTSVQLRCLESEKAESWEEKHPGLLDKILKYCNKLDSIDQINERKDQKNHTHQRHSVQGWVKAVLLDKSGKKTNVNFNGELVEISRSGTSFSLHCNKKATVKQLLGRSFHLTFSCGKKGKENVFSSTGRVVRATSLLYNDYLLHVGFHTTLPEELEVKLAF